MSNLVESSPVIQVQNYQQAINWGMVSGTGWLALLATLMVIVKFAKGN